MSKYYNDLAIVVGIVLLGAAFLLGLPNGLPFIAAFVALCGSVFLIGAATEVYRTLRLLRRGVALRARVTGYLFDQNWPNCDGPVHVPIYVVEGGKYDGRRFEGRVAASWLIHDPGAVLSCLYDDRNNLFMSKGAVWWSIALLGVVLSIGVACIGLATFIFILWFGHVPWITNMVLELLQN
ncbi:MAG: hypothetical protein AAGC70_19640 [Pseudomonadota bacterium]